MSKTLADMNPEQCAQCIGTFESPWYVDQPPGTIMRRFVGEWEKA